MTFERDRRRFLGRALALAASLICTRRAPAAGDLSYAALAMELLGILREPASAAAVGRRCIELFPGATVDSHLETLVRDVPELATALEVNDVSFAHRSVGARSRWDFDHDNIVDVDGWVLSSTEARVYALAALLEERA